MNHNHRKIANHSPLQQRMFFAVSSKLGYKSDEVKERAKLYFNKDCFNDLTKSDLMFLIDKLMDQVENKKG